MFRPGVILLFCFIPFAASAQKENWKNIPPDSLADLSDFVQHVFYPGTDRKIPTGKKDHIEFGVFPAIGYTLQTGFAAVVSANAVIYRKQQIASDSVSLPSTLSTSFSFSEKNQLIVPFQAVLYLNNHHQFLLSDWRYLKFPSYTYGLGMNSSPTDSTLISYQYFKFHQSILFQVYPHIYAGVGYVLDYFWKIHQVYDESPPTDFQKYGTDRASFSSGIMFNLIRDTRDYPVNAYKGSYARLTLSPRFTFLGSDASWTSLTMEYRTYIRFPELSNNILALWSYNWLTLSGNPPYLMLPNTGWNFPTGRGYIQSRFRSNNMVDAEAEYRIQITRNGLFGMVIFANLESFTEINTWQFGTPAPGAGVGLRVKLNKYSRTNISIDYGWGRQESRGFFVNLGEVF